jgi:IS5 family transposase
VKNACALWSGGLKILRQSAASRAANDKTSASFAAARAWKNKSQPCAAERKMIEKISD